MKFDKLFLDFESEDYIYLVPCVFFNDCLAQVIALRNPKN